MHGSRTREILLWLTAFVLLAGYGIYAAWSYGLPWIASSAASLVPIEWERQMGESAAAALSRSSRPCLEDVAARLERALPSGNPYRFVVRCVDAPDVNAFAAPGGFIFVYDGLLRRMNNVDQTAAVLAHEMQHVLHRHATRALFRAFALQAIFAVTLGDFSGLVAQAAGGLGSLHYMRADERDADRDGTLLLKRAGFDPLGMPAMLESLGAATRDSSAVPVWISSHPDTRQRIADTRALAGSLD